MRLEKTAATTSRQETSASVASSSGVAEACGGRACPEREACVAILTPVAGSSHRAIATT